MQWAEEHEVCAKRRQNVQRLSIGKTERFILRHSDADHRLFDLFFREKLVVIQPPIIYLVDVSVFRSYRHLRFRLVGQLKELLPVQIFREDICHKVDFFRQSADFISRLQTQMPALDLCFRQMGQIAQHRDLRVFFQHGF